MKVLLDENLPVKLKYRFSPALMVFTVNDLKWNSLKDTELLKLTNENHFDAFVTSDKNIVKQQRPSNYSFRFIILLVKDNQYDTLLPLVPSIEKSILTSNEKIVEIKNS